MNTDHSPMFLPDDILKTYRTELAKIPSMTRQMKGLIDQIRGVFTNTCVIQATIFEIMYPKDMGHRTFEKLGMDHPGGLTRDFNKRIPQCAVRAILKTDWNDGMREITNHAITIASLPVVRIKDVGRHDLPEDRSVSYTHHMYSVNPSKRRMHLTKMYENYYYHDFGLKWTGGQIVEALSKEIREGNDSMGSSAPNYFYPHSFAAEEPVRELLQNGLQFFGDRVDVRAISH